MTSHLYSHTSQTIHSLSQGHFTSQKMKVVLRHVITVHSIIFLSFSCSSRPIRQFEVPHIHIGPSVESFQHSFLFYIFFPPPFPLTALMALQYFLSVSIFICNICFYVLCTWMCPPKVEKFYEAHTASASLVTISLLLFIASSGPAVLQCACYRETFKAFSPTFFFSLIYYMIKD